MNITICRLKNSLRNMIWSKNAVIWNRIENEKEQKRTHVSSIWRCTWSSNSSNFIIRECWILTIYQTNTSVMECLKDLEQASIQLSDYFNTSSNTPKPLTMMLTWNISIKQVTYPSTEHISQHSPEIHTLFLQTQ